MLKIIKYVISYFLFYFTLFTYNFNIDDVVFIDFKYGCECMHFCTSHFAGRFVQIFSGRIYSVCVLSLF